MTRWLVVLDDPELFARYRAEVEAPDRMAALKLLGGAATAHTVAQKPELAGRVTAAVEIWGIAVPLDGDVVIDLTDRTIDMRPAWTNE